MSFRFVSGVRRRYRGGVEGVRLVAGAFPIRRLVLSRNSVAMGIGSQLASKMSAVFLARRTDDQGQNGNAMAGNLRRIEVLEDFPEPGR